MLSRVVVPAGVILAAAPLAKVHAAESEDKPQQASTRKVKPSELPIYGEPLPTELEFIPEPSTPYRDAVTSFRKSVWSATEGMQGTIDNVKSGVAITKDFAADTQKKIQEDSGVLQRAGIITVAGLGGVVAGYKGGILRKAFLASAAMTTAAAICYPNQAVDISNTAWFRVKQESVNLYEDVVGKTMTKSEAPKEQKVEKKVEEQAAKDVQVMQGKDASTSPSKPQEDHGQSKPEDKDMYTTRS